MKKSELRQMIREAIKEELSKKSLQESSSKAYKAMMKVQGYITDKLGWDIIDCQQDDEYSMLLKCDVNGNDDIDDLENYCDSLAVEVSVMDSSSSAYDVRVYLSC